VLVLVALGAWMFLANRTPQQTIPVVVQPKVQRPQPQRTQEQPVQTAFALQKPAIVGTLVRSEGVLRGGDATSFRLLRPVATVVLDDRPRFEWQPTPDAKSYEVAVADVESGSVAATGTSETTSWRTDEPLPRGRTYSWQVTAKIADGALLVAPGPAAPEALFHVIEAVAPLPEDPLERGVALANLGALDEAEQSLQRAAERGHARAGELLDEVRSWRPSSQGLPTTTNGAQ
jgi:hypothetical protein